MARLKQASRRWMYGGKRSEPPHARTAVRAGRDVAAGLCARQRPPGLSVAVVGSGEGAWREGFGLADIETRSAADADTAYLWFSMTKLVTATAVMQLVDRGQLELDTPVTSLVPEFPNSPRASRVTVRHLLSHSAGLANPIPVGWVRPADAAPADPHAFTARLLNRHSRPRAEPGRRASHSNLAYLVLGEVIRAAAGAPYVEYVRAQILEPLGMSATDFVHRPDMASRAATATPRTRPLLGAPRLGRRILQHHARLPRAGGRRCRDGQRHRLGSPEPGSRSHARREVIAPRHAQR